MPIYEYECGACGHRLEILQKVSDEPLKDCPKCQAAALQKLVSAAGFQLKGTGWYVTDYKGKSGGSASSSTTSTETKSTDSSSSSGSSGSSSTGSS